jgi:poly(3-hydroxybutyrate) depolymerase
MRRRSFTQRALGLESGISLVEHWQLHGAGHAWSGGHPDGCQRTPVTRRERQSAPHLLSHRQIHSELPVELTLFDAGSFTNGIGPLNDLWDVPS